MVTLLSLTSSSSSPLLSPSSHPRSTFSITKLRIGFARRVRMRMRMLRVRCLTGPNSDDVPETENTTSSSSLSSISAYNWCAGLGSLGFLETGYLTYLKLTNSDAFCPVGGGCDDILNSNYAALFGIPLPLIGMVAYGLITTLGVQLAGKNMPFGMDETNGRLVLLGSTTSLATASAFFLYILSTKFAGVSCTYCLLSALLSFSLFFITLKDFGLQGIQKVVGLQLCVAGLVIAILITSYNTSLPASSLADVNLQPFTIEITTESSPFTLSLARHLRSIGAKMYGAFWCSHCIEQKQMFGRDAVKLLDYVECFPDGYKKGIKIAKACADVGIEGFPTWVINGEVLSGEQELSDIATASGFKLEDFTQKPS